MPQEESPPGKFQKVGQCLYRYASGMYYGVAKRQSKLIRKSLGTKDLTVARRKLKDFLNELDRVDVRAGTVLLGQLVDRTMETLQGAESTLNDKRRIADRIKDQWPGPLGSRIPAAKVKTHDIAKWLASYGMAASNHNAHLWFVQEMFEAAVVDRLIPYNPAAGCKAMKRSTPIRITPTYPEFLLIIDDLRSQQANGHGAELTADFIEFMGEQGLGQAEIAQVQRQHVDVDIPRITLFRAKTKTAFTVPIFPNALPVVNRRLAEIPAEPTARLFPFDDCKKGLTASCLRLKLPHYTQRSLRRMFITKALRRGVDVQTVSDWQGHQDGGKLILGTYADVVSERHSQKMAILMADEARVADVVTT